MAEAVSPPTTSPAAKKPLPILGGNLQTIIGALVLMLRRLAFGVVILLVIVFFTHLGLDMAQGTPIEDALLPSLERTLDSLTQVLRGDLGMSQAASSTLNPLPVSEVFAGMILKSLGLLFTALLIAIAIGIPMGVFAARRRGSGWSTATLIVSIIGISLPSFFLAFLLQRLAIEVTRATGQTFIPVGGFGWDAHLILPALVLAARPIAQITRITSGSIIEVQDQDYVRTARSKGLAERLVRSRHVIRNAAIPIATTISLSLRFMLISLPVVEAFFGWPGLGFYLLRSIPLQDEHLTVILVLCLGALFILVNMLMDLVYLILDPRLRNGAEYIRDREGRRVRAVIAGWLSSVADWVRNNPVRRWSDRRKSPPQPSPYAAILRQQGYDDSVSEQAGTPVRRKSWLKVVLGNPALILGTILVLLLLTVALFGHLLSPNNPYATKGLSIEDGEFLVPPFEPDGTYPWGSDVIGRDVMSLILTGAWQTLRLAALVVCARVVVGFVIGSIGGWNSGRALDRVIQGSAEVISAFPALLLAMIIILALGIREGFPPFVIALCFVGWGEVMQYVRGETMAMRSNTYIESAVAVGQGTSGIIRKHVLPNLTPAMISIIALEMGAVLMILGELGFVGVFIGGGAFAELDIGGAPYHYSDVPEWGALMSNVRVYAQTYIWTAFYPALAFFIAILGFNLFGEGIRKLVSEEGIRIRRIINQYTVATAAIAVIGLSWWRGSTGAISIYQRQASTFDGGRAYETVAALTSPLVESRSIGTVGMDVAAEWIASQFSDLGLQPAGRNLTYFQERTRDFQALDEVPCFVIDDAGPLPVYQEDYVEYPGYFRNLGAVIGEVRYLGMGEMTETRFQRTPPALDDADFAGEIIMVLGGLEASYLRDVPLGGILVVTEDAADLKRSYTLSPRSPLYDVYGTSRTVGQDTPILWISEGVAGRILSGTGMTLDELRKQTERLGRNDMMEVETGVTSAIQVAGTVYEKATARNVIGHWPGTAGMEGNQLDDRLIVVLAKYDTPPLRPDGTPLPAANDNASGVAIMLEAIRIMKESGYQPYKTFLFVAYTGEGLEGGVSVQEPEIAKILQAKSGFSTNLEVEAIVDLRGLGAGEGSGLLLETGASLRLADLFEDSARRMGLSAERSGEDVDISAIYRTGSAFDSGEEAPKIGVRWEGWEAFSWTSEDTLDKISPEKLEEAGQSVALALMTLGREIRY